MKSTKHRFRTISILIGVVGCLGGLGWLVYLNGNFNGLQSHRPGPIATGPSNLRAYSAVEDVSPAPSVAGRPTLATVSTTLVRPALVEPTSTALPPAQPEDWHSIDPDTQKAIKILLGVSSTDPGASRTIPLPAQYQPGPYNPLGPPSLNFQAFDYFLKQANSPAQVEAISLYNTCLKLYCDPAVALAFFQHESSMGRQGAAAENKSWGNIRCTPGAACRSTSGNGSFKLYSSWNDALIDWVILMRDTYATRRSLYSLEQIIPHYAPSSDNNDPNGYINTIKKLVDKYRSYRAG